MRKRSVNSKFKVKRFSKFYFGPNLNNRICIIYIRSIKRNLYFTITDLRGRVIQSVSARGISRDRKKRTTETTITLMAQRLLITTNSQCIHRAIVRPLAITRRSVLQILFNTLAMDEVKV